METRARFGIPPAVIEPLVARPGRAAAGIGGQARPTARHRLVRVRHGIAYAGPGEDACASGTAAGVIAPVARCRSAGAPHPQWIGTLEAGPLRWPPVLGHLAGTGR